MKGNLEMSRLVCEYGGVCEDSCLFDTCGNFLFHLPGHDWWINLSTLNRLCGDLFFGLENVNSFGSPSWGSFCVIVLL